MPEIMYDTQEAVPEDVRGDAVAKDGKFAVSLVSAKKLDEFRNNNIKVVGERDNLANVIGRLTTDTGFKPEEADAFVAEIQELRGIKTQVDNGKLIKDTSLDDALAKRTGEMKTAHDAQVRALTTATENFKAQVADLQTKLNDTVIDRDVSAAAANATSGIRPDAIRAVIREARDFFQVIDGKLVAKDHDGNVIYGADGTTPMLPLEWIKTRLSVDSPFLFKESAGGGAGGNGTGAGGPSAAALAGLSPAERMRAARAASA